MRGRYDLRSVLWGRSELMLSTGDKRLTLPGLRAHRRNVAILRSDRGVHRCV